MRNKSPPVVALMASDDVSRSSAIWVLMLRRLVEEKVEPKVTHARTKTIRYRLHVGREEGESFGLGSAFSVSRSSEELSIATTLLDLGIWATKAG